jgi:hypothetical protein
MSTLSLRDLQGLPQNNNVITVPSGHQLNINQKLSIPVWTTSTRPTSPTVGLVGYNTSFSLAEVYNGTSWVALINSNLITADSQNSILKYNTVQEVRSAPVYLQNSSTSNSITENLFRKKYFSLNKGTNSDIDKIMLELNCNQSFVQGTVFVRWGTRMQGISDANCQLNERAWGFNRFNNGNSVQIENNWSHVTTNVDARADINLVNTSGTTAVLRCEWRNLGGSSFVWGYVEVTTAFDNFTEGSNLFWYI